MFLLRNGADSAATMRRQSDPAARDAGGSRDLDRLISMWERNVDNNIEINNQPMGRKSKSNQQSTGCSTGGDNDGNLVFESGR